MAAICQFFTDAVQVTGDQKTNFLYFLVLHLKRFII